MTDAELIETVEIMLHDSDIEPGEWCQDNGVLEDDLIAWCKKVGGANARHPHLGPDSAVGFAFQVGFECGKRADG